MPSAYARYNLSTAGVVTNVSQHIDLALLTKASRNKLLNAFKNGYSFGSDYRGVGALAKLLAEMRNLPRPVAFQKRHDSIRCESREPGGWGHYHGFDTLVVSSEGHGGGWEDLANVGRVRLSIELANKGHTPQGDSLTTFGNYRWGRAFALLTSKDKPLIEQHVGADLRARMGNAHEVIAEMLEQNGIYPLSQ